MYEPSRDSTVPTFVEFHWEERPMEGEGACAYPDGSAYSGFFKSGYFHGDGTFTWPDGSQYTGQWDNDLPHRHGTILLLDGHRYKGEWQHGVAEGKGTENAQSKGSHTSQLEVDDLTVMY